MAQLPPKVPTMSSNWPNFSHQRTPSMGNMLPNSNPPSWVDEFLDFSSAKRSSHRRSASDSIAFLEAPLVEECESEAAALGTSHNEFDRLDDEQLMSMFSGDISTAVPPTVSTSNPSTPSDHNSINEEKPVPSDRQIKNESEVQSSCKLDPQVTNVPSTAGGDSITDPKRVKR